MYQNDDRSEFARARLLLFVTKNKVLEENVHDSLKAIPNFEEYNLMNEHIAWMPFRQMPMGKRSQTAANIAPEVTRALGVES